MKIVGSGFCYYVHDRTRIPAVLGVEGVGDDAKFFDAIRRRLDGGKVHELVVGIAAVDAEIIGAGASAVDRNRACILRSVEKAAIAVSELGLHAGLQLQELVSVARVQGQLIHRAVIDDGAQLGAGSVNLRSFGGDFDDFLSRTDLQYRVERDHLVDIDQHAGLDILLETGELDIRRDSCRARLPRNCSHHWRWSECRDWRQSPRLPA